MSRDINPFGLRMQPGLRKAIEESATETGRSLNSEITFRLQSSLEQRPASQAKRDVAIQELRDAAAQAVQFWELENRSADEEDMLRIAMEDIELWLRQLQKIDDEASKPVRMIEAFLTKGPEAAKKVRDE